MLTLVIVIFVLVYAAIALEHPLKVNKSASALLGAGLLWTIYAMASSDASLVTTNHAITSKTTSPARTNSSFLSQPRLGAASLGMVVSVVAIISLRLK